MTSITNTPAWQNCQKHFDAMQEQSLTELFENDPQRFEHHCVRAAGLTLDYSKNHVDGKTISLLCELAETAKLHERIEDLFTGVMINSTEKRPALHTALRQPFETAINVDGIDIRQTIQQAHTQMQQLVDQIHGGTWRGFTGKPITDIVNIGIGGSDLGPRLVVEALTPYHLGKVNCHFIANIDASEIDQCLKKLNPETTLFIVASKSFTTQETLTNATVAKDWIAAAGASQTDFAKHFIAVTAKPEKAQAFGMAPENILPMWDWVGGRYSLWSAIGLPIALAIGMPAFQTLLEGSHEMDKHFKTAPFAENIPVLLALIGLWYRNFFHTEAIAVLPYDQHLALLPAYLQQLEMESNGKSVTHQGEPVNIATGPILWGGVESNGQHAFHQLLHQGKSLVPVDFIIAASKDHAYPEQHAALFANCLSQSQALMRGRSRTEIEQELRSQGLNEAEIEFLTPPPIDLWAAVRWSWAEKNRC